MQAGAREHQRAYGAFAAWQASKTEADVAPFREAHRLADEADDKLIEVIRAEFHRVMTTRPAMTWVS